MFKQFLFVEMERGDISKAFEGLAAGEFTASDGRKVAFKKDDLPTYVENTLRALESTKDSNGEVIGLPIDGKGHDHGDAAGWIVMVQLSAAGDKILFTPRWTDLGKELIGNDIQRYFSPSVDPANKVILGGSLTNWPATRLESGEILLKPVELSQALFALADESLDEQSMKVRKALGQGYGGPDGWDIYAVEVFSGYVIAWYEDELYRINYTEAEDGGINFQPMAEWKKVKQVYVETMMRTLSDFTNRVFSGLFRKPVEEPATPRESEPNPDIGEDDMTDLTVTELVAQLSGTPEGQAELARMAQAQAAELVEAEKRKAHVAEFAARAVGGSDTAPRGLPVVKDEIEKFLLALTEQSPELAKQAEDIFEKTLKDGLVDFAEKGHSRTNNKNPLPEWAAKELRKWVDAGNEIAEFFAINNDVPELGKAEDYNLSEFEKKGA